MTYQQVIEQSKTFTNRQKKQLAYYLLYPTLQKDKKKQFEQLFDIKIDFDTFGNITKTESFETKNKRIWRSKEQFDLKGEFDNIRKYIYDEEYYNYITNNNG